MRQKDATATTALRIFLHLLRKMRLSSNMRPDSTRPTKAAYRTARATSQRHCCTREKTKNPSRGGCARACTRTQSLSDGAEAGNRPYRRRGRADPVDADRGAVSHAQRAARKVRSRKRLIVVLRSTTSITRVCFPSDKALQRYCELTCMRRERCQKIYHHDRKQRATKATDRYRPGQQQWRREIEEQEEEDCHSSDGEAKGQENNSGDLELRRRQSRLL